MDSDENYGEFDDSAFLAAANQLETAKTSAFQSPRPLKRRKIAQDERLSSIPSKVYQKRRTNCRPFYDSDDDTSSNDGLDPAPLGRRGGGHTLAEQDDGRFSTHGSSMSPVTQQQKSRLNGVENQEEGSVSPRKKS